MPFDLKHTYKPKPVEKRVDTLDDSVFVKPLKVSTIKRLSEESNGLVVAFEFLTECIVDESGHQLFNTVEECEKHFGDYPMEVVNELVEAVNEVSGLDSKKN